MLKNFIYSLMTDKRKGVVFAPLKGILYLASLGYAAAILLRKVFYRLGLFKVSKVPLRIISVGNLTLGGTGKTPFVIKLAKMLEKNFNKDVGILIRGYGWDEQAMLKKKLHDMPVLVREDRVDSARKAIRLYGCGTAILDDGFQYWELKRDLDIVLVDSRNPFGNNRMFPRGVLREHKDALRRADVIVLTKVDRKLFNVDALKCALKRINEKAVYVEAKHTPRYLYDIKSKKNFETAYLKDKRVMLLSSIGDPKYFKDTVKDSGAHVVASLIFPDHYDYKKKDIEKIKNICAGRNFDFLVITEKDAVKLSRLGLSLGNYTVIVLVIEMEIVNNREGLIAGLHRLYHS